jgi:hypothetical protein
LVLRKLQATPIPQRGDFLGRLAAAGVFGDAESRGNGILKIHARRQNRFSQDPKAG